jgi:hypothetical protein
MPGLVGLTLRRSPGVTLAMVELAPCDSCCDLKVEVKLLEDTPTVAFSQCVTKHRNTVYRFSACRMSASMGACKARSLPLISPSYITYRMRHLMQDLEARESVSNAVGDRS